MLVGNSDFLGRICFKLAISMIFRMCSCSALPHTDATPSLNCTEASDRERVVQVRLLVCYS